MMEANCRMQPLCNISSICIYIRRLQSHKQAHGSKPVAWVFHHAGTRITSKNRSRQTSSTNLILSDSDRIRLNLMFHVCVFFCNYFSLFAFKEMAADVASCLTMRRDDLACPYQTYCKITTFTYCFLVTDLATLTGSCVECFKTTKFLSATRRHSISNRATSIVWFAWQGTGMWDHLCHLRVKF